MNILTKTLLVFSSPTAKVADVIISLLVWAVIVFGIGIGVASAFGYSGWQVIDLAAMLTAICIGFFLVAHIRTRLQES